MKEKRTTKPKPKRFVPTVPKYKEDIAVLRAAGPNVVLQSVLKGGAKRRSKP